MATTTVTDWKTRALAAYESQQAAYKAEERQREACKAIELGDTLQRLGIECEPDAYPYTFDGVTFRLKQYEDWEPEILQVRRVCAVCGDVPGADSWTYVQSLEDLGRALSTPYTCYAYARHAKLRGEPTDDPATVLVEALRAFIASERGEGNA